jgi:hypothetical protein
MCVSMIFWEPGVELLALRQQLIQMRLPTDAAQGRLRNLRRGVQMGRRWRTSAR